MESQLYIFCDLYWDLATYLPFTLIGPMQINCPQQPKFSPFGLKLGLQLQAKEQNTPCSYARCVPGHSA